MKRILDIRRVEIDEVERVDNNNLIELSDAYLI